MAEELTCPHCGQRVFETDEACVSCGGPLEDLLRHAREATRAPRTRWSGVRRVSGMPGLPFSIVAVGFMVLSGIPFFLLALGGLYGGTSSRESIATLDAYAAAFYGLYGTAVLLAIVGVLVSRRNSASLLCCAIILGLVLTPGCLLLSLVLFG